MHKNKEVIYELFPFLKDGEVLWGLGVIKNFWIVLIGEFIACLGLWFGIPWQLELCKNMSLLIHENQYIIYRTI